MPTRRRKFTRYVLLLLGPALLVGILVFLKFSQISLLMAKADEAARAGPPPEAVGSMPALAQHWEETVPAVGTVADLQSIALSSEAPGRVKRVHFESGAVVERGQVLLELDTSVERAELGSARAERDLALVNARRSRALYSENVVPRAELDSDEATLQAANKSVAAIEAGIERKTVRAPFSGRLGLGEVEVGEYLNAGSTVTVLEAPGEVFVDFTLPQSELDRVKAGMAVRVVLEGAAAAIEGTIHAVDPALDAATRSMKLRAGVKDPEQRLRPGMFVRVSVVLPSQRSVVAVPASAVIHAPYGDSVFVIVDKKPGSPGASTSPSGKPIRVARQQFVRLGQARGDFVAIAEGIAAGQLLVSAGAFKLRNGSSIVVDDSLKAEPSLNPRPENR